MEKLRLLNDLTYLARKIQDGRLLPKANLAKAQTRLTMFELLATDARFG